MQEWRLTKLNDELQVKQGRFEVNISQLFSIISPET